MAMRFRRSIKLMPGVKVNVGKKSASVTFGGKILRKTINTNGQETISGSLPGTGMYWTEKSSSSSNESASQKYEHEWTPENNNRSANIGALLVLIISLGILVCTTIMIFIMALTDWIKGQSIISALATVAVCAIVAWIASDKYFR